MMRSAFALRWPTWQHHHPRVSMRIQRRRSSSVSTVSTVSTTTAAKIHPVRRGKPLPSRIVFGSCASQREQEQQQKWTTGGGQRECCWEALQGGPYPPDITILMGDNVYADEFNSIEDAYRELLSNGSFQRLRGCRANQLIATMDDNDYTDDLERGKIAFLDQFVNASPDDVRRRPGRGIYDAHIWRLDHDDITDLHQNYNVDDDGKRVEGDTADEKMNTTADLIQIILLDVRYHATPDDLLGETQWQWLSDQLRQCQDETLRIIVSPIQILPTAHRWECWNERPDSRRRLLDLIASTIRPASTVILLSGDRHVGAVYQDRNSKIGIENLVEITSSSLTHTVPSKMSRRLDEEYDGQYQISQYVNENNFGELSIDWQCRRARVSIRSVATRKKLQRHDIYF